MNEITRNEIKRLHADGASCRQIAKRLCISRNSVRHVLHEPGATLFDSAVVHRASVLDQYAETIKMLVERYPDITGVRLHEELRRVGFSGSYTIVRERLREIRPQARKLPVERFETLPGKQGQMDYSTYTIEFTEEGTRTVSAFSYVLGYSRRPYLRFVESQDFYTTIREHVNAFEYLGGVAASCLYDNFKVVVDRIEDGEPIYNARFLAFATHYGFQPIACRVRRPQTKGKVERHFDYIEKNLLNGRTFRSLAHLNEVCADWLRSVADVRIHRETKRTPFEMHAEELPHLLPLPQHRYETAEVVYRSVDSEGRIPYRSNRYSVPWQHIGETVVVRVTDAALFVYSREIVLLTEHVLASRTVTGQKIDQESHRYHKNESQTLDRLAERFAELGEVGERFLKSLIEHNRYGKLQGARVLTLLQSYAKTDVQSALERASRYNAYSYSTVERILAHSATPKTPIECLADEQRGCLSEVLEKSPLEPRDVTEYQKLLDNQGNVGEPKDDKKDEPKY